jgi:hypothetical protein
MRVPGKELSHEGGDPLLAAPHQKMDVRFHEHPGIKGGLRLHDVLAQAGEKLRPFLVVAKNIRPVDSPHPDVVQGAWSIEPGLAWHGGILWKGR